MRPCDPYAPRRLVTDAPVELVERQADPVILPALAALTKAPGEAEVRAILDAVPEALHVVMVDRMAGRQHFAPALRTVLRVVPRDRLKALGGARLSRLYQLHRSPAQPVR